MKVGDLVQSTVWTDPGCTAGIIVKVLDWNTGCTLAGDPGAMVMWEHGEICFSPVDELEVISEGQ